MMRVIELYINRTRSVVLLSIILNLFLVRSLTAQTIPKPNHFRLVYDDFFTAPDSLEAEEDIGPIQIPLSNIKLPFPDSLPTFNLRIESDSTYIVSERSEYSAQNKSANLILEIAENFSGTKNLQINMRDSNHVDFFYSRELRLNIASRSDAPSVTIIQPVNNFVATPESTVLVGVDVIPDRVHGSVVAPPVEILENGQVIASDMTPNLTGRLFLMGIVVGRAGAVHTITARAKDNTGAVRISTPITIRVQ